MANRVREKTIKWQVSFDNRVYPLNAVAQAVKDYAALGVLTVRQEMGKTVVAAVIQAEGDFHFREEFANYVLGMVFKCRS